MKYDVTAPLNDRTNTRSARNLAQQPSVDILYVGLSRRFCSLHATKRMLYIIHDLCCDLGHALPERCFAYRSPRIRGGLMVARWAKSCTHLVADLVARHIVPAELGALLPRLAHQQQASIAAVPHTVPLSFTSQTAQELVSLSLFHSAQARSDG